MSKRTYEVAVEKLTKFAEVILKHVIYHIEEKHLPKSSNEI